VKEIADTLHVSAEDVVSMNRRLSGDTSLNVPARGAEDGGGGEWQDWLQDDAPGHEQILIEQDEIANRRSMLERAMTGLNARERRIFRDRRLREEPKTLEALSEEFHISRERVRQIEVRAFEKVQEAVRLEAQKQALAALPPALPRPLLPAAGNAPRPAPKA